MTFSSYIQKCPEHKPCFSKYILYKHILFGVSKTLANIDHLLPQNTHLKDKLKGHFHQPDMPQCLIDPRSGTRTYLENGVLLPSNPFALTCARAAKNLEVATYTWLSPFTFMGVLNAAEHIYLAARTPLPSLQLWHK